MARIFRTESVSIQTEFYIAVSLALLVIPVWWVVGWLAAIFFHEFCHYLALRFCRVSVFQITIGAFGADMLTDEMSLLQETLSALAGPFGSLLLLCLIRVFPCVSLCALGHLVFNLIPIYPLDGGRVVHGICVWLFGKKYGVKLSKVISFSFIIVLICYSILTSLRYKLGLFPIIVAALIIVRSLKIPCKERKLIVQ